MAIIALLITCILAEPEIETPSFFAANAELKAYLVEAGEHHPELKARHTEWLAKLQRIPQVTSLDDPMFTYGQFLQSDMNRFKFALAQKFPWFGTLRTRGDKASAEAEAALEKFYSARNRVFAVVKRAYFEYGFLGESIQVTQGQIEILEFMEEIVRSKYSLGLASEDQLLRVQIERTKVQDRLDGMMDVRPAASAKLSEALGRTASLDLAWPQKAYPPPPHPAVTDVLDRIRQFNPDLMALDNLIESRVKQGELARKKGRPNLTVGIDYASLRDPRVMRPDRPFPSTLHGARRLLTGTTPGPAATLIDLYSVANANEPITYPNGRDDNIMVSFKVNLPIWRKRIRAGVEEARLLENATGDEKQRKTLALDSAAHMAIFGMEDAVRRFNLYQDSLIPKAQQSYQSLQSAYASGDVRADFLDLLDSVRLLLDFELEQVRASRDLQIAASELEFLIGGPWKDDSSRTSDR